MNVPVPGARSGAGERDSEWITSLDELGDEPCTWCGGEPDMQECDDPIQCCDPRCDGELHPDPACGGTGLAEHQVIW